MQGLLSERVKVTNVLTYTAANTNVLNTSSVNMAGYDGVMFVTRFGTAAANNVMKAQQSSDDANADDFSDLEGTSTGVGASDEGVVLDLLKPGKQYVRAVITPGTSSTVEGCWAIRYGAQSIAVANSVAGTLYAETSVSPAEGTA